KLGRADSDIVTADPGHDQLADLLAECERGKGSLDPALIGGRKRSRGAGCCGSQQPAGRKIDARGVGGRYRSGRTGECHEQRGEQELSSRESGMSIRAGHLPGARIQFLIRSPAATESACVASVGQGGGTALDSERCPLAPTDRTAAHPSSSWSGSRNVVPAAG